MLVRQGDYFCINRGRQYGKTTTLAALKNKLEGEGYAVFSMSFEGLEEEIFSSVPRLLGAFVFMMYSKVFCGNVANLKEGSVDILMPFVQDDYREISSLNFRLLMRKLCCQNKLVVLIDEVDQAGNYPAFISFLGLLRDMFLNRDDSPTFLSVILAGVYDVKNLKLKIRATDDHQYNSPWNIAVPFDSDMSLSADGISAMLNEYKIDHGMAFDNEAVGQMIFDYTSGYPFLVSRICQIIDQNSCSWDKDGVLRAIHELLNERNTLFDDMIKKLDDFPELKDTLRRILYSGARFAYNPDEKYMQIAMMFNFVKVERGALAIACRLMETRLYNYFLSEEKMSSIYQQGEYEKS